MNSFLNTSNKLEDLLIVISQTDSFLSGEQYEKYKRYILNDFTDLLSNDLLKKYTFISERLLTHGLLPVEMGIFEIIRYYSIYYQNFSGEFSDNEDDDISKILTQNDDKLLKLNYINEEVIKKWYEGFLRLMSSSFKEYKNKSKLNLLFFLYVY